MAAAGEPETILGERQHHGVVRRGGHDSWFGRSHTRRDRAEEDRERTGRSPAGARAPARRLSFSRLARTPHPADCDLLFHHECVGWTTGRSYARAARALVVRT